MGGREGEAKAQKSNATGTPERGRRGEGCAARARNGWERGESAVWSRGAPFAETKAALEAWLWEGCARAVLGVLSAPAQGVRRRKECGRAAGECGRAWHGLATKGSDDEQGAAAAIVRARGGEV